MQSHRLPRDYFGTRPSFPPARAQAKEDGRSQSSGSSSTESYQKRTPMSPEETRHTYAFAPRSSWPAVVLPPDYEAKKNQHAQRSIRTVQMDFMKPIGLSTDPKLRVMRTTPGEQADAKGIRPGMQ